MNDEDLHIEEVAPSPRRLVESLRDTGYSSEAAFADIVDNSIAANADHVEIDIDETIIGNEVTVSFYDNGSGMNEAALVNAMRYGSEKRPSPDSLGKFGMGLKTASTSFCRKLTVITRCEGQVYGRCWDIDRIKELDKWVLSKPPLHEYAVQMEKLHKITGDGNGTVVIWEEVDRLITASGSDYTAKAMDQLTNQVSQHLSAIFGKFLIASRATDSEHSEEVSKSSVKIILNDNILEGWDPTGKFLNTRDNPNRVIIQNTTHKVTINWEGSPKAVPYQLNGYVLPRMANMNSEELDAVRYANENQGFYIYRHGRLIFGGGWPHRMFKLDNHLTLLRVELNFDHYLDDFFEIDIRKSKINLPTRIREEIKKQIAPWRNEAAKRYREDKPKPKPADPVNPEPDPVDHKPVSPAIERQYSNIDKIKIVDFNSDNKSVTIRNRFGEIELNRAEIVSGTDIYVTTTQSLEGGMLWRYDITEDKKTVVILNEEHEFYRRFYLSSGINPILIQAMDSLFWSLANGELNSITDQARDNFEELRLSLSNTLRHLAKELPDVD